MDMDYEALGGLAAQALVFALNAEEHATWIPVDGLISMAGGGGPAHRAVGRALELLEHNGLVERKIAAGRGFFRRTIAGIAAAQDLYESERTDLFDSAETTVSAPAWRPEPGAPASLEDVEGQSPAIRRIRANLAWAQRTERTPANMLFVGPSGTGKTLLAGLTSRALGGGFVGLSGADLRKPDLDHALEILTETGGVLFIDEIATSPKSVRDALLVALDPARQQPFVAIGATTDPGELGPPLRRRFQLLVPLESYDIDSAESIAESRGWAMGIKLGTGAAYAIARAARCNPAGIATMLLEAAMLVEGTGRALTAADFLEYLEETGRDGRGVDALEVEMLVHLRDGCRGPVGLRKLAQVTGVDRGFVSERLRQMCREGLVLDCGTGGHTISSDGRAYLRQRGA